MNNIELYVSVFVFSILVNLGTEAVKCLIKKRKDKNAKK